MRATRCDYAATWVLDHPWAMTDAMRTMLATVIARHVALVSLSEDERHAVVPSTLPQPKRGGNVAVIPVNGVIAPKMTMFSEISGGTSFQSLGHMLQKAVDSQDIATIVLDIDSPGGSVAGATEFAADLLAARVKKPIIAQVNHTGCSAAYWLASCCTKVHATKSSLVGSVGVFAMHNDISEALAQMGVKREIISAGKYKAEGQGGGPLSDEARAHVQGLVDESYAAFVDDIAAGRGVKASDVRKGFGEGRAISAATALRLGMIDKIDTLSGTLGRLMGKNPDAAMAALVDDIAVTALVPSPAVSAQEPATEGATAQELRGDAAYRNQIHRQLFELSLR